MIAARLSKLADRIDALSLRERAIVLVTGLAVVYLAWDALVFQALDRERTALENMIEDSRQSVSALNEQVGLLAVQRGVDPNDIELRAVASLRAELSRLNESLVEATHHLVPPAEMARVLEAVLTHETQLELVHLEGLGVEPLLATAPANEDEENSANGENEDEPGPSATVLDADRLAGEARPASPGTLESGADVPGGLYRHGLRIEFLGTYLETMRYLAALERLNWRFLWESVRYRVERYPRARVSIVVHSLSFDDAWIGV